MMMPISSTFELSSTKNIMSVTTKCSCKAGGLRGTNTKWDAVVQKVIICDNRPPCFELKDGEILVPIFPLIGLQSSSYL